MLLTLQSFGPAFPPNPLREVGGVVVERRAGEITPALAQGLARVEGERKRLEAKLAGTRGREQEK